ncbi:amino acid ABC transporter permease [Bhargavaea ginsengi]|uniref:amino acid ABC transporter permease n=1 Tax=Bhargavaea ginsengi TaxID=426757 RepID=UPI003C7816E7
MLDIKYMLEITPSLLSVLHVTLIILIASSTLGLGLSILVTAIRIKKVKYLSKVMDLFISFTRSVPIVLQLFLMYYGFPFLLSMIGIHINDFSAAVATVLALTLYNAGYLSEVLRPAYLAVEKGQHEAADGLGYTPFQKFTRIIAPQVIPIALPGWGNALVYLIHDTSLIFTIGVADIMGVANTLVSSSYGAHQIEIYLTIALLFWAITVSADTMVRIFEKKAAKYNLSNGFAPKKKAKRKMRILVQKGV